MKLGIIEEGNLQGKKIVLEPRAGLRDNEWLIEQGVFTNGAPMFTKYCLICEKPIPASCDICTKETNFTDDNNNLGGGDTNGKII